MLLSPRPLAALQRLRSFDCQLGGPGRTSSQYILTAKESLFVSLLQASSPEKRILEAITQTHTALLRQLPEQQVLYLFLGVHTKMKYFISRSYTRLA